MHVSTKTYHDLGPCCFRQHKAESHCRFLHGYSLSFRLIFGAITLDERGWVMDFGGLKQVEQGLRSIFDHTTIIAEDDPHLAEFEALDAARVIDLRVLPAVGCEAFAEMVYHRTTQWLTDTSHAPRVRLLTVEVMEHNKNSAIYEPDAGDA